MARNINNVRLTMREQWAMGEEQIMCNHTGPAGDPLSKFIECHEQHESKPPNQTCNPMDDHQGTFTMHLPSNTIVRLLPPM